MNYAVMGDLFAYILHYRQVTSSLFHHYVVVGIADSPNAAGTLFRYSLKYVTHVEFEFNGFTEQEMQEFMGRFDRAYQRGGG